MELTLEKIIEIVTREVIKELTRKGIDLDVSALSNQAIQQSMVVDMTGYKTPILTASHLEKINPWIKEIVVPKGTILSPGARDIIKRKALLITNKS